MSGSNSIADSGVSNCDDGTIRSWYDWTSTHPSTAVVETVAAAANRSPTALDPLYENVDPDALDRLVQSRGKAYSDVTITFTVGDYRVSVSGCGEVVVESTGTA